MTDISTQRISTGDAIADHVRRRVVRLQREYARGPGVQPTSGAAATMAALRRADPAAPGDSPAVWAATLDDVPDGLCGHGNEASKSEQAIHASLCLYAVHQQSRPDGVHREGVRFGQAVGRLARARATGHEGLDGPIVKRFHNVGTASRTTRRLSVLRSLLQLMRSESPTIALDYGLLAQDLYDLSILSRAAGVRLAWGRDLHRAAHDTKAPGATVTPLAEISPIDDPSGAE